MLYIFKYCHKLQPDLWICSQKFWPLDHRGGQLQNSIREYLDDIKTEKITL
jgi:hypothetical protein